MCASSLVNFVEVVLCCFEFQGAWYGLSDAGARVVVAKDPAFIAVLPGVRSAWSFLGLLRIWY